MPTTIRVTFRRDGRDQDGRLVPARSEDLDLDQLTPRARVLAQALRDSLNPPVGSTALDVVFESATMTNAQRAAHRPAEYGPVKDPDELATIVVNCGPLPRATDPTTTVEWLEAKARDDLGRSADWYPVGAHCQPRVPSWEAGVEDRYLPRDQAEAALREHGAPLSPAGWQTLQRAGLMPPDRFVCGRPQWRPETVEAFATRARELWTVSQVAERLGLGSPAAAGAQMRRWGIPAEARQPGRTGENLYPGDLVQAAHASRPGRGARTDLEPPPY